MEEQQTQTTHSSKNSYIIGAVIIVALMGALAWWFGFGGGSTLKQESPTSNSEYPAVVATVNGEELSSKQFSEVVAQTENAATQQGLDIADESVRGMIEDQALTVLINTEILIQGAEASGITATTEQVDEQIALIETQFGSREDLEAQMATLGLTDADLREDISEQLMVEAFILQSAELEGLEVSDEEVRSVYETLSAQGEGAPPFETIAPQIKEQLLAGKQQEATNALIERLRAEADIVVTI